MFNDLNKFLNFHSFVCSFAFIVSNSFLIVLQSKIKYRHLFPISNNNFSKMIILVLVS